MSRTYRKLQRTNVRQPMSPARPLLLDLCCGLGGWATAFIDAGWDVIGIDNEPRPMYPGHFILADVRSAPLSLAMRPTLIVASPPCGNYSRARAGAQRPGMSPADLEIWDACVRMSQDLKAPIVIENVLGAEDFHGPPVARYGSRSLWGDCPALVPYSRRADRKKNIPSQRKNASLLRARIPYPLAEWLAHCFASDFKSPTSAGLSA